MFLAKIEPKGAVPVAAAHGPEAQGWPAVVDAMIAEIRAGATEDQARGFFAAVGHRIADLAPMSDVVDAATLSDRINALWATLGWGSVTLQLDDEGIDLQHRGTPAMLGADAEARWSPAVAALLEGAYDGWFRALGSGPNLRTRVINRNGDVIELRHGL